MGKYYAQQGSAACQPFDWSWHDAKLLLLAVSPFWQQVVKGLVILAAVAADKMGARKE
jgi:hypothetical protein